MARKRPSRPHLFDDSFADTLRRAQSGDQHAFATLWRELNPLVERYLRGLAGNHAEDLATETWIGVVRGLPNFTGSEGAWRGWVFTIARRRWVDWCRRRGARPEVLVDEIPEHDAAVSAEDLAMVGAGLDEALALVRTLTPDQADAVLLRVVADLDVATVAEITGKSPGAVRVLTHRGLGRLAELAEGRNDGRRLDEVDDVHVNPASSHR